MNSYHAFPYQQILRQLPISSITKINGYYKLNPHKGIRLFVNINNDFDEQPGIFIFSEKDIIGMLRKSLTGCKEIYNFNDKEVYCLFLPEASPVFQKNIERLISWIKQSKKGLRNAS